MMRTGYDPQDIDDEMIDGETVTIFDEEGVAVSKNGPVIVFSVLGTPMMLFRQTTKEVVLLHMDKDGGAGACLFAKFETKN